MFFFWYFEAWSASDVAEFAHRMCAGLPDMIFGCRSNSRHDATGFSEPGLILCGVGGCHKEHVTCRGPFFSSLSEWDRNPPTLLNPPPDQKVPD